MNIQQQLYITGKITEMPRSFREILKINKVNFLKTITSLTSATPKLMADFIACNIQENQTQHVTIKSSDSAHSLGVMLHSSQLVVFDPNNGYFYFNVLVNSYHKVARGFLEHLLIKYYNQYRIVVVDSYAL
ncbi:hypothetical protein [Buttiauxella sp. S19-1]|uniref:hypothetical protein n=1 Tax=Buttiauxella sp. S19-1 TaxID=941430 RepID=UPI001EDA98CB|nr:hypothetical protein [Buttiauxella sp. S19-1]